MHSITLHPSHDSTRRDDNFRSTIPNIKIDGSDTELVCRAKLLGVTISQELTWTKHVENIVKKADKPLYVTYQLKRVEIIQKDLVTVYVSVVRPVLEYACSVWHNNLPQYLSDNIENIQKRPFNCIFPGLGYTEIPRCVNVETLQVRRDSLCQNCFDKIKFGTHRPNTEQMNTVTPLYRGNYTTASKKGTTEYSKLIRYHELIYGYSMMR